MMEKQVIRHLKCDKCGVTCVPYAAKVFPEDPSFVGKIWDECFETQCNGNLLVEKEEFQMKEVSVYEWHPVVGVMWTRNEAIQLVQDAREIAMRFNYHIALGGSLLYNGRSNKDADIYFLPMHGTGWPNMEGLLGALDFHWGIAEDQADREKYPTEKGYRSARKVQWKLDPTKRIDFWVLG
jgi:hypothetical protein